MYIYIYIHPGILCRTIVEGRKQFQPVGIDARTRQYIFYLRKKQLPRINVSSVRRASPTISQYNFILIAIQCNKIK